MKLRIEKNCWQQDFDKKDYVRGILEACLITLLTAWLYYRSFWAVLPLLPLGYGYYRLWEKEYSRKKRAQFQLQFKDAIQSLSSALNVGYSVENAFKETQKELAILYGENERIMKELRIMIGQIRINLSIEKILEEFSMRVESDDVRCFTTVFAAAKRSGGDMIAIIKNSVSQIGDKIEAKREIDTLLAAKKYEFKVMTLIPYFIIGYMSISFPEFMQALYGTMIGTGVMSLCLLAYIGAYYLGVKIIEIEV